VILMAEKKLLEVRAQKKAANPRFSRHAAHRKKRLANNWRSPRGLHNKLRLHKKSRGANVSTGYRGPVLVRGLTASGKKSIVVSTLAELTHLEPDTHAIIVSGKIGNKKRLAIIDESTKHKFEIVNLDAKAKTEKIKAETQERALERKERTAKQTAKEKAAAEKEQKESEKAAKKTAVKKTAAKTDEEKLAEKQEQDKILTKKDQ